MRIKRVCAGEYTVATHVGQFRYVVSISRIQHRRSWLAMAEWDHRLYTEVAPTLRRAKRAVRRMLNDKLMNIAALEAGR